MFSHKHIRKALNIMHIILCTEGTELLRITCYYIRSILNSQIFVLLSQVTINNPQSSTAMFENIPELIQR